MPKYGAAVIHTPADIASGICWLIGHQDVIDDSPEILFHPLRIDFLASLSKALLTDDRAKALPDVTAFAFWCRRANIEIIARSWSHTRLRIGLGLIFHISPSNVAINFAYSLVFSFLSGNSSVIRLSSKDAVQTTLLTEVIGQLLADDQYASLRPVIHLIRYDHSDHITEFWLQHALGRIVWGGDATVAHIRSLKTHPRSREITFVDRYSLSAIAARPMLEADEATLHSFCSNLYNDIYLMDQNACSSPQLLLWVGSTKDIVAAQTRLWPKFSAYVNSKYTLEPVHAIDKFVGMCCDIIENKNVIQVNIDSPLLTRITLSTLSAQQYEQRGYFGTIHNFAAESLDALVPVINSRFQTLAYFGFTQDTLRHFITTNRLSGIDRIVPIGRALDMSFVWDGFEMLLSLSRVIDIQR